MRTATPEPHPHADPPAPSLALSLYPIDWRELSASIRFRRAKGLCETCRRPHGRVVLHLGDGRWWDDEAHRWRDGCGKTVRRLAPPHSLIERTRTTRVVLATAHRDHDPQNNEASNLAALCQRCHILHDKAEHLRRRRLTYLARWAIGDLSWAVTAVVHQMI